ncbi:UbiH/UbiF/VisC/COQ6 family ubiquinone biosynthesis hydroxylase [Parasphingorhabdus cellanae]|uniref:UbiH/UbiF/VisC/COQ6 family ubiquinone biosynthesis hydroxylase n=1 Tax=Parasphingorhabdus cellanae TaxID=2806553 RepID=A0ABX7T5V9_9SPHN|nr:UbiH/UbiF/VisC/COQ6 family ubiquinone biosynthesis hydroxylase [Parasphingorhabdus cellanae]QTD56989.1 UbiH/UbiF/VisC/COQ6 family ubiquinone biosynthesis hydroxylase [Parasphingorhabdus cellanae]
MTMTEKESDVIILGAGLIGLTQALTLAAHGLQVTVIDRAEPTNLLDPKNDGRVSSINSASWNMLAAIGLTEKLELHGCNIDRILINDGLKPGKLDFTPDENDGPLGVMIENGVLQRTLFETAQAHDGINLLMPRQVEQTDRGDHQVSVSLDRGEKIYAPLFIAADGRGSTVRDAAGIAMAKWQYNHSAITCTVTHEQAHGNTAYEIFYSSGPFAVLPMRDDDQGRHRSAIVWTVAREDGPALAKINQRAFQAELMKNTGSFLGQMELQSDRITYPLGFHHSASLTAERLALVGDAGHGIHPIAGQGLNLGLRDVAALTECIVDGARTGLDLGDAQILERYDRWRGLDNMMMSAATDILTRLFGLPGDTSSAIRRFGIGIVQRIAPLKDQFMAEARGESGDLPKLLMGDLV